MRCLFTGINDLKTETGMWLRIHKQTTKNVPGMYCIVLLIFNLFDIVFLVFKHFILCFIIQTI